MMPARTLILVLGRVKSVLIVVGIACLLYGE
jgi:hypothetical protein